MTDLSAKMHLCLFQYWKNHYNSGLGNFRRGRMSFWREARELTYRAIITGNYSSQRFDLLF